MLRKMIIPLFALAFAVVGAFASPVFSQMGWFKSGSGVGVQGTITVPGDTPACLTTNTAHTCLIGSSVAYDTKVNAENQTTTGILKYN